MEIMLIQKIEKRKSLNGMLSEKKYWKIAPQLLLLRSS